MSSSACNECAAGKYLGQLNDTTCTPCALGRFAKSPALTECETCVTGKFTAATGKSACSECDAGEHLSNALDTECGSCAIGKYSTAGEVVCTDCELGEYTPATGQTVCSKCDPGQFSQELNARECKKCARGSFTEESGQSVCETCDAYGQFTPLSGSTVCSVCSDNSHAVWKGNSTECVQCPESNRLVTCINGQLEWQTGAWYDEGKWTGQGEARKWTSYNKPIDENMAVHACFNDMCCRNPTVNGTFDKKVVECVIENGYYGPLCGGCDMRKDFMRTGYVCQKCTPAHINYLVLCALAIAIFVVVVYVAAFRSTRRRVNEYGGVIRRIAFSYMQVRVLLSLKLLLSFPIP